MNIIKAQQMLRQELDNHGLYRVEAKMNNRLTTSFGRYIYYPHNPYMKIVELSGKLVEINSEERVRQTILHEIAHALTEGHNHDYVWRMKCVEIGGDGNTFYNRQNTNTLQRNSKRYQAFCPEHGSRGVFYKRVNRACGSCCDKYNNGKYSEKYQLQFIREV